MLKKILVAILCVACIATMCLVPLSASAIPEYANADDFHAAVQEIGALTANKLAKVNELLAFGEANPDSVNSDDIITLNSYKTYIETNNADGWYFTDDFDNFQPEGKTYGWWECINSDTVVDDFKVVAAKEKLKTEDFQSYVKNETNTEGVILSGKTNHCLAISALPSTSDKTLTDHKLGSRIPKQIMALPDSIVNGKGIMKASFKYFWDAQYTEYSLILSRHDNLHYSGIKLASKDFGISKVTCNIDADKFCTEETLISKSDLKGYYYATWVDVTLEYITKEDGNYYRVTFLSPKTISNTANTENLTDVVEIKVGAPVSNLYFTGNNVVSSYKYNKLPINHRGIDDVKIAVTDKPIVEGTTIRSGSDVEMKDQTLQFNMDFSFAKYSVPANATDIEYGVLFASKSLSELDLNTAGIKNVKITADSRDAIDTDVSIYITDSSLNSGNSGKKCSVRAYIKYNIDDEEIVIYSENSDTNKGITNGIQNKSLIGTVKSILLSFAPSGASDENFAAAVNSYNTKYGTKYTAEDVWGVVTSANAAAAKQIIPDDAGFDAAPKYTYRFVMYTVLCLMQNQ